jgi:hypothetical protein
MGNTAGSSSSSDDDETKTASGQGWRPSRVEQEQSAEVVKLFQPQRVRQDLNNGKPFSAVPI